MGFVKTPGEIAEIEAAMTTPRFVNSQMLNVDFLVDPAIVARILPPPLTPADTPRLTAMVGRWQSNCVGDYDGGAVYVSARHGDLEGDYVLAMWMNTDAALIYGRDLFGEPKKLGASTLRAGGTRMNGTIERGGVRLVELEADLDQDHGATTGGGVNFNFKARPSATGVGLEEDAILTVCTFETDLTVSRSGKGALSLQGTAHDPLDELVVEEVLGARYVEGILAAGCHVAATVPAADFLPYALGRMDDWSLLDTEARQLQPA